MTVSASPDYFRQFAAYAAWANARLYDTAARLDDAARRKDRGAFFGSIHNTLNHLLLGDRVWLARLEGTEHGVTRLDEVPYPEFDALRHAAEGETARLARFCEALDEARLASICHYRTISGGGVQGALPVTSILAHLFNHQTHHRGQVHAMLTQDLPDVPGWDLLFFLMQAR